jgi:hypothetical protein
MYTHDITMRVLGDGHEIDIEGELDFELEECGGCSLRAKFEGGVEATLKQREILQDFLCVINRIHKFCGEIEKIEINVKP